MVRIKADDLIELFERMARENWRYEWGAAREGCVDCSGAFVYAYKALGGPYIEHGSNSIARKRCGPLQPISAAQPGWACFKRRDWRESDRGKVSSWGDEIGDLYHIGLMGRDGRILNAQGEKNDFESDSTRGWTYAAPLLAVDYDDTSEGDDEMATLYQAEVTTQEDPLTLRALPGGKKIGELPRCAVVDVLAETGGGWARVRYGDAVGYASMAYLTPVDGPETGDSQPVDQSTYTSLRRVDGDSAPTIMLVGKWTILDD